MPSFIKNAGKKMSDIRTFLRDSASGNSLKYSSEKNGKHQLYIPFQVQQIQNEDGSVSEVKTIYGYTANVHEWKVDGKFHSAICLDGVFSDIIDGKQDNDGTCPFCNRVQDGWDIVNYRKQLLEQTCTLPAGKDRDDHLLANKKEFLDERKASEAKPYMYMLVAQIKTADGVNPSIGQDGLPEFELKIMRNSTARSEKINETFEQSGIELEGNILAISYPNIDDRKALASQATFAALASNNNRAITSKYPALVQKIADEAAKFDWEGISKSFPEWKGMTTEQAKRETDSLFRQWDEYKTALESDPTARYLEYVVESPSTKPSLGNEAPAVGSLPNGIPGVAPQVGIAPQVNVQPQVAATPQVNVQPQVNAQPQAAPSFDPNVAPSLDPNAAFANIGAGANVPNGGVLNIT